MSYLLIALIIMVALSPLISAMPTRRQRLIADFRQTAALAGLYVQLKASPLQADGESPLPFYGCRRSREDKPSSGTVVYRRVETGWAALHGHWPTQRLDLLEALPIGVRAVCEDLTGVGVFWDEQGERADVEHIAQTLRELLNPQGPA